MHMHFFVIQENKVENLFMSLYELFLAFQINFHHHKFFNDLQIFFFKKLHDKLMNCCINLSFSVYDNIT